MNERRTHWLRKNAAERLPRRMVTFDCESYRNVSLTGERHEFRCAVAAFDVLDPNGKPMEETRWLHAEQSSELWWFVADWTNTAHRTVCFAHNLSYDMRISLALRHLPSLSFQCRAISLNSQGSWAQFRNNYKSLWLCDSLSFVPVSLERIAGAIGKTKPSLPSDDATEEEWLARCRADVETTREAMLRVLAFLRRERMGDFRQTGAAQSSAGFRHRFLREKTLLVHDDDEALAAERRAAWSGRAEVWRHGEINHPVHEFDYTNAYARIGQRFLIPTRLQGVHSGIPMPRLQKVMESYAVLADCSVDSNVPCVPTHRGGYVVWPTGTFRTTLWDCEVNLALDEGANVQVERYWFYKRSDFLKPWADWILGELAKPANALDPVIRFMLKDWSRALIGRFGLRYSVLDHIATLPTHDVVLRGVWDMDDELEREYLQIGERLFERTEKGEAPNSTPFVMSWIMAQARVQLWEAMKIAGEGNCFYCDTDGLLVNANARRNLQVAIARGLLPGMRHKASWQGGDFRSPRNIDLGETRRVTGAPRAAERLAPSVYRGEVWESLQTALRRQRGDRVFLHNREFTISETDRRREHLPDGSTRPWVLGLEPKKKVA